MAFFTLEALFKIFAYGFIINGDQSYLQELWNIIDFLILVASYICMLPVN